MWNIIYIYLVRCLINNKSTIWVSIKSSLGGRRPIEVNGLPSVQELINFERLHGLSLIKRNKGSHTHTHLKAYKKRRDMPNSLLSLSILVGGPLLSPKRLEAYNQRGEFYLGYYKTGYHTGLTLFLMNKNYSGTSICSFLSNTTSFLFSWQ